MGKVTIEIDSRWVKIVPFSPVLDSGCIEGSRSLSPRCFCTGQARECSTVPNGSSCLPVRPTILLVGLFYMLLGGAVIGELRKKKLSA